MRLSSVRVSIGAKKGGLFNNTPTDGSDRVRRFQQLLDGPVGEGLCRMYARYWQPAGMARYLEEAALYSKDHKSTVSITDSVSNKCNCIAFMSYAVMNTVYIMTTATVFTVHTGYCWSVVSITSWCTSLAAM